MMRSRARLALAAVVVALGGLAVPATAQPRRSPGGSAVVPAERGGDGGAPGPRRERKAERREQVKKKIRAMRAYTLTEELALDEPTAARLFPVLARFDDETDKLLEHRVELQRRLRRVDTVHDPRAIDRTIDEAVANQRSFAELEDRRIADLRKILTPVQIARLLVVLPVLERRIETQLRQAIVGRPARGTDDDDDRQPDELPPPPKRAPRRREAPLPPAAPSQAPGNTPPCNPNTETCR